MKKEVARIEQLIRGFRKAKGLSQMQLAERIGVSYQQVQKYEKGTSALSITRLMQIAHALDVPLTAFFPSEKEGVSEPPAPYGKLDNDEQLLLHLFRGIKDKRARTAVIAFLKTLSGTK